MNVRLQIDGLSKSFAAPVLSDVSLKFGCGEIHGLVGENGAGKSTMLNIIAGTLRADAGTMVLDDQPFAPHSPRGGLDAGIARASQELAVFDTLSVAENIAFGSFPSRLGFIDRNELSERARGAASAMGLDHISLDTPVTALSVADRQLVDLARCFAHDSRVLLLDEPTAALTQVQAERLHQLIRERARMGATVIYVSHRLKDVIDVADRVSVLRGGQLILTASCDEIVVDELLNAMTAVQDRKTVNSRHCSTGGDVCLRAENILTAALPDPISLQCRRGEILGIAGLAGSGRSTLLRALFGLERLRQGRVVRHYRNQIFAITDPVQAVRCGLGYIGEDRHRMGIFAGLSLRENVAMAGRRNAPSPFRTARTKRERAQIESLISDIHIRCHHPDQDIASLSGGNQQKALFARWLYNEAEMLLLDEPMRGIDPGTKLSLFHLLRRLKTQGRSAIMVSSDFDELCELCDRVIVVSSGRITAEFSKNETTPDAILAAAFAQHTTNRKALGERR